MWHIGRFAKTHLLITPGFKARFTRYLARSHSGLFRWIVDQKVARALVKFADRPAA